MKVRDLIERLKTLPADADVSVLDDGYFQHVQAVKELDDKHKLVVLIIGQPKTPRDNFGEFKPDK